MKWCKRKIENRNKWDGDIPPYKPIFHDGWAPGVIDFPEDDEDDLSTISDYSVIRELQRPKVISPPVDSSRDRKFFPERNKRIERQVEKLLITPIHRYFCKIIFPYIHAEYVNIIFLFYLDICYQWKNCEVLG